MNAVVRYVLAYFGWLVVMVLVTSPMFEQAGSALEGQNNNLAILWLLLVAITLIAVTVVFWRIKPVFPTETEQVQLIVVEGGARPKQRLLRESA